jgi:thiamine transport system ATP-binding protein
LLDEPLSALDRGLRERLAVDVRDVLRETRTTAVFVTHDHDEASTVADRVAVMLAGPSGGGRIDQVAPPEDLWRTPVSPRVAEFLGYQAFLPDGDGLLAVGPAGLRIVARGVDTLPAPGLDRWDAVVVGTVFRRGRTEVTVEADLGDGVRRLLALADGAEVPPPGEKTVVGLDRAGCAHVPA